MAKMAVSVGAGKPGAAGRLGVCLLMALSLAPATGCTRQFFRHRADEDVADVLTEKNRCPAWAIQDYHVYPDPRARFGDPTDPDRPPMPPDDPAAHCLSPNPQRPGKQGVELIEGTGYLELLNQWDAENRAEAAGNSTAGQGPQAGAPPASTGATLALDDTEPGDQAPAPRKAENSQAGATQAAAPRPSDTTSLATKTRPGQRPPYLLKLEQAVELGLINSREYQDARENLYLAALPVTLERFAFAPQVFAAAQALRTWAGRQTPGGSQNSWTLNSNTGFSKLFPTGALLLMNFANQTVFNLAGTGRHVISQSTINLNLIQPLLQGAGYAVTLEPLTLAERRLLYAIRDYARFRKTFYVAIAGGGGGSITGGTFQPTGIIAPTVTQGLGPTTAGLVPGSIPAVPVTGNPGLRVGTGVSGQAGLATSLTSPVSGYLTTLLQAAQMRVDEYNIAALEGYLALARAMEEGGDISQLQVDQFEQQLLVRRSTLLTDQQQYLLSLEQFKLQLGLPEYLRIELDDSPFRPLNQMFRQYEDIFKQFEEASREPLRLGTPDRVAQVRPEFHRLFTRSAIVQGTPFRQSVEANWGAWERLSANDLQKRLADFREERGRLQGRKAEAESARKAFSPAEQKRLDEVSFQIDLGDFEALLRDYERRPWTAAANPGIQRRQQQAQFRYVVNAFILVLAQARNERVLQLRDAWPTLARLCVDGTDLLKVDLEEAEAKVTQHALANRLDLMNVRAELVDAWRQVRVFANALLGVLNVSYALTATTAAGLAQPLNFSGSRTTQQLGLSGELPLVRIAQRNNYRAALINYQRARRILMRAEDEVAFSVRNELILLRQQEEDYRIQQRQVELAYLTVENSLDTFQAPPAPTPAGQSTDLATRAAALTSQLIQAQTSLYQAQFQMTTIWITYLNTRLQLYRDMELMPLDYRGVWIDDVAKCECPDGDASRNPGAGQAEPGDASWRPTDERGRR